MVCLFVFTKIIEYEEVRYSVDDLFVFRHEAVWTGYNQ